MGGDGVGVCVLEMGKNTTSVVYHRGAVVVNFRKKKSFGRGGCVGVGWGWGGDWSEGCDYVCKMLLDVVLSVEFEKSISKTQK